MISKITNIKQQITNNNQSLNTNLQRKVYDLEERTFQFSKNVVIYCKKLPKTSNNLIYNNQVIRSSSSIGANYIEANEALSKKDFLMRVKICRKEAKESAYWFRLIIETNDLKYKEEGLKLYNESVELKKIFSSILLK